MIRRIVVLVLTVCVLASCSDAPTGGIDEDRRLQVSGDAREYRLVVPAGLSGNVPLVVVLHGFGGTPDQVRELSGFSEMAAAEGFAVAFPAAAGIIPAWRADASVAAPDLAFIRAVVEDVATVVPLDRGRVYAAGMSNGGGMTGRLACSASDLFAAVGVVAAAHGFGVCDQVRPVPIIAFHGDADRIVPMRGIPFVAPGPLDWIADRAAGNGCEPDPVVSRVSSDVEESLWMGCEADVAFYLVEGGRHGWPGSDRSASFADSTTSISATALIWEFFVGHPLP